MSRRPDAVVVGGGVVGSSVAFHLAREGLAVCLLERQGIAAGASGAAAGMLRPFGEAEGKGAFLSLARRSLERFPDLVHELRGRSGIDPELERSGALYLALSDAGAETLRAKARRFSGGELAWLDAAEARARAPGASTALRGALWSACEAHVHSARLCRAFVRAAETLGARWEPGVEVRALRREGGRVRGVETSAGPIEAEAVVLCPGVWTSPLCDGVAPGWRLPVEPVRGQSLALDAPLAVPREILVAEDVYLVPKRDGRWVLGATEERVGFDAEVTSEGVAGLLRSALAVWPLAGRARFRGAWAGLRPATPDGLPAVGAVPGAEGLFVAAGHFRNGVLLAPLTGEILADLLAGRGLPDDADLLDPARFASPV